MQPFFHSCLLLLFFGLSLLACGDRSQPLPDKDLYSAEEKARESARAKAFFEAYFERLLSLSPERLSILGRKEHQDKWTRYTAQQWEAEQQVHIAALAFLQDSLQYNALIQSEQLNYELLQAQLEQRLAGVDFRYHNYPLQQERGLQRYIPAFLQRYHSIENTADAQAYLQRLQGVPLKISDILEQLKKRSEKGILPPPFVFKQVAADCRALLSGYPLEGDTTKLHPLYLDFLQKIAAINLSDSLQNIYRLDAERVLIDQFGPAYQELLSYWERLEPRATPALSWQQFPKGEQAYAWELQEATTTVLSAEAMHQMALREVESLQAKVKALMMQLGFRGSLPSFLKSLSDLEALNLPRSDSSIQADRSVFEQLLKDMQTQIPKLFSNYPPLAKWNIDSLFARYEAAEIPHYEMQAWLYHEVLPGGLFQQNWMAATSDLPRFRQYGKPYRVYLQGWQAYAEHLLQEKGAYRQAEALLGHLTRALWRAAQLVVDTGIHSKGWTLAEALDYYLKNTAATPQNCQAAVAKQAVLPGRATGAQIGLLHLQALRQKAIQQLGANFDEGRFHEVLLQHGAVGLGILEDLVDRYIAEESRE